MTYSLNDGKEIIKLARSSIESSFKDSHSIDIDEDIALKYNEKRGVFVTLNLDGKLRGCIGFIKSPYKLYEGIMKAARLAAFDDPRFPPITYDEYKKIEIEISILTPPELIDANTPEDCLKDIKICRDGLIVENGVANGCLLPQVPQEWQWDERQFIEHTCLKAGMDKDEWKNGDCKVSKFTAQIFAEKHGYVVEKKLL